jgi:hypothetical protein
MDPNNIVLESVHKLFEYEQHARIIDKLNEDELRMFAKSYCKLYLKQQETLTSLMNL